MYWLSAIGLADFSLISLYQTGLIRHLPDLPFPLFDSDKVNASKSAYQFGIPDGPVSLAAYGLTMALTRIGDKDGEHRKPVADLALGAVVLGQAAGAAWYLGDMLFRQRKICLYCVAGALVNFASAVVTAPLVFEAGRKLFHRTIHPIKMDLKAGI